MKLNRSNYKIAVSSKKQAKQFKQALLAVGERVTSDYWADMLDVEDQNELMYSNGWFCATDGVEELITFKELLTLIVKEEKPGLLDGKCAIQVNNEREFKLLMQHYESKGWKSTRSTSHYKPAIHEAIDYHDDYFWDEAKVQKEHYGYKVIPFDTFAAELGIKVPVLVMKSTDGVDLYEGDYQYVANQHEDNQWFLLTNCRPIMKGDETSTWLRVFSTKEASEKWIEEQNKPKELIVSEDSQYPAIVTKDYVDIDTITISREELEEIYNAWKSLQD